MRRLNIFCRGSYLFGASISLGLVLRSPNLYFAIGLDQLAFNVQTRFGFFFQLDTNGLQFRLDLSIIIQLRVKPRFLQIKKSSNR